MEKILVIDDEKNIQVSLASILEDEGYKVFLAGSGEEGLEKFKNIKPAAIFLDIWLPGIDGLETMKQILKENPLQPIIMISGHGNITTAVRAVKEGAYDFLEKPLSIDKVIFVLQRAVEYRKVMEENIKLKSMIQASAISEEQKRMIKKESTGTIEFNLDDAATLRKQRTVGRSSIFYGIGLHSGEKTGLAIKPLSPGKGIRFENISEVGYIPARVEFLDTTLYATSIRKDDLEAKTIEHFMATLHAAGITNLSIKINKEVPVGDGSASEFCRFIKGSGVVDQEDFIPEVVVSKAVVIGKVGRNEKYIKIEPADAFIIKYTGDFPEPIGRMSFEFVMDSFESFEKEIAPARTYGFVDESIKLAQMGLAEGGRINNFILIDKGKVINTKLRFENELVRHKILDIIGDFYLLGRPIRGKVTAQKTGHTENLAMVNLIKETFIET
jgi:UDP-3-O-[3-hydroxymyristoyl] N-acetylglucosamine deacetylase